MIESYKIIYTGAKQEIIEKKSRFIAQIKPVKTEAEALEFITELKKQYWDASHNCFAYTIGMKQELVRCSDDGEPQGTAGRPMLDILVKEGLHDVCVVVTRYFGGTLLGTGGLVRAYGKAVSEGLKECVILEKTAGIKFTLKTEYTGSGKVSYLLNQRGIFIVDNRYGTEVETDILLPLSQVEEVCAELIEALNGKIEINKIEDLYYGIHQKEVVLL